MQIDYIRAYELSTMQADMDHAAAPPLHMDDWWH